MSPEEIGGLLGLDPSLVRSWASGQTPMPRSMAAHIGAVLGVSEEQLLLPAAKAVDVADVTPAVWFKFRGHGLADADREVVFLARQMGVFLDELESVRGEPGIRWSTCFEEIRQSWNINAAPAEQGRQAAVLFRSITDLRYGNRGVGDLLRPRLRELGLPVIESPIRGSRIEGCTFVVGRARTRPCIFVNSYQTTWFRRNALILHEVAHALFDLGSTGATLDLDDSPALDREVSERRADAFAQEALVPSEVLNHLANQHGIKWSNLEADSLSLLVAETQAEQRLVLRAAQDAQFISREQATSLSETDIWPLVKKRTQHALTTREYIQTLASEQAQAWSGKRHTTVPSRRIRVPVSYAKAVVEAQRGNLISVSRAAKLLMITSEDYVTRFPVDSADEAAWG